jgi:hypothetical protein
MLSIKPGLHTLHSPREQAVVRALADEAIASRGAPGAIAQLRELGAAKGGWAHGQWWSHSAAAQLQGLAVQPATN